MLGWSDIYRIGLGYLGLSEEELHNTTFSLFNYRYEGYLQREWMEWDRMRTLAVWVLTPHLGKSSKLKPEDLITLPIDAQRKSSLEKPSQLTPDQRSAIEEARKRYEQTRKK